MLNNYALHVWNMPLKALKITNMQHYINEDKILFVSGSDILTIGMFSTYNDMLNAYS